MATLAHVIIEAHETLRTGLERMNRSGRTVLLLIDGSEDSVSDRLFERGICLPSGSNMTPAVQRRVIDHLSSVFAEARPVPSTLLPDTRAG